MKYVSLPNSEGRRLTFYLAMEEFVARSLPADDYFFMWQVQPTVIFGRNQLIENEVNLDFCRRHGIQTYRRKSGGGCVYADMSNVMFSYITPSENVQFTFNRYIMMVVAVLQRLGIDATTSGRNDVLVDGRKVSGNAFYHLPQRSIVHGTMLYDTNLENMVGSITPSSEKLRSKGIESVRQRIALLKNYTDLPLEDFKAFVRKHLCNGETILNGHDERQIVEIEREYLSDEFIYGRNPKYNLTRRRRIEGVGDIEVRMVMKNNTILSANMAGDYLPIGDLDGALLKPLVGTQLEVEALQRALPERLDQIVMNLQKNDFILLLTNE